MIPNKQNTGTLIDNLGDDTEEMTLDLASLNHIMSILTDMYSDPEDAILREYSTNGLDSHKEAGITRPIEVTLPNPMSQNLIIRDFGLGLSTDEIRKVYGSYGKSTKRNSNLVAGMLGLGSKSALTYANSFTVSAIKDGIKSVVAFMRNGSEVSRINVVDVRETDEANGVTITIPVKQYNNLESKAEALFFYWEPGTVLVNGKQPKNVFEDAIQISEDAYVVQDGSDRLVMGSVPYPANLSYSHGRYGIVGIADIGSVDITPSREELQYTDGTEDFVKEFRDYYSDDYVRAFMQQRIEDQPDIDSALNTWRDVLKLNYRWGGFTYKDIELTNAIDYRYKVFITEGNDHLRDGRAKFFTKHAMTLFDHKENVFIEDRPDEQHLSTVKRKQLQKYMDDNNLTGVVYFCDVPDHPLFGETNVVKWDTILSIELPKSQTVRNPRPKVPEYPFTMEGVHHFIHQAPFPAEAKRLVYSDQSSAKWKVESRIRSDHPDTAFVALLDSRKNGFLKRYPHAISYTEFLTEVQKNFESLSEVQTLRNSLSWNSERIMKNIQDQTDDPIISEMWKVDLNEVARIEGSWYSMKSVDRVADYFDENYPLASAYNTEHTKIYINAIYNLKKEETS